MQCAILFKTTAEYKSQQRGKLYRSLFHVGLFRHLKHMSCIFLSVNFMSVNFVPGHFDGPSFSCPSFSAPPSLLLRCFKMDKMSRITEMFPLASGNAGGCTKFDPRSSKDDEKVGEFTDSEHCTAEYQTERSADVTHETQQRVRLLILDVRVRQLREKYLHRNRNTRGNDNDEISKVA